jgi:hypothetical protein
MSLWIVIGINTILVGYEISSSPIHLKSLYSKNSFFELIYYLYSFNVYRFLFYAAWVGLVTYGFWCLWVRSNLHLACQSILVSFGMKSKTTEIGKGRNQMKDPNSPTLFP